MTQLREEHLSGIRFDWVRTLEIRFVDNPDSEDDTEQPSDLGITVTVETKVATERDWCRTLVRVKVTPPDDDPEAFQTLVAAVEGSFSVVGDVVVEMDVFSRRQAPAILMPYVREAISRVTTGSRIGPVLLPPINVVALIEQMERRETAAELPREEQGAR